MKTILCYGDSNTWGYEPGSGNRYPQTIRWTGVLQQQLGTSARVIEEGLNGRTTVYDEPVRPGRNGAEFLPTVLETHTPIDVLVLMLGTNDILKFSDVTARESAQGISKLIDIIRIVCSRLELLRPEILLVSPPLACEMSKEDNLLCQGDPARSSEFSELYFEVAQRMQCEFIDAAELVEPSVIDGAHLDADEHRKLGQAIAQKISEMI